MVRVFALGAVVANPPAARDAEVCEGPPVVSLAVSEVRVVWLEAGEIARASSVHDGERRVQAQEVVVGVERETVLAEEV